jgi:predicted SnoaL-like aldol condensation-catalyzing enzyme
MAFKNGNPDAIENVISDDYLDHTAKGDVRGKESVKANIARLYSRFKNIKMETIKEFADNDYGFFWMRFSGEINNGPGKPSTPYDNTELQIVKFKDGKAIEHWSFIDQQNFMRMMPNNTNSKNTESNSKK